MSDNNFIVRPAWAGPPTNIEVRFIGASTDAQRRELARLGYRQARHVWNCDELWYNTPLPGQWPRLFRNTQIGLTAVSGRTR